MKLNSKPSMLHEKDFLTGLPDLSTALSYLDSPDSQLRERWLEEVCYLLSIFILAKVGNMLIVLGGKWQEDREYLDELEKLITYLSDLTQDCLPERMQIFSSSPEIVRPLLSLIFSWLSIENKQTLPALQYHHCYHLAVFTTLGMINGRNLCELFLQVTDIISTT